MKLLVKMKTVPFILQKDLTDFSANPAAPSSLSAGSARATGALQQAWNHTPTVSEALHPLQPAESSG